MDLPLVKRNTKSSLLLGYKHPVVIVDIRQRQGSSAPGDLILRVVNITSFKDTPLETWLQPQNQMDIKFNTSIPIYHPSDRADRYALEENGLVLYLEQPKDLSMRRKTMSKQCYIALESSYDVPIACLRTSWSKPEPYHLRLAQHSFRSLMDKLSLQPGKWTETAILSGIRAGISRQGENMNQEFEPNLTFNRSTNFNSSQRSMNPLARPFVPTDRVGRRTAKSTETTPTQGYTASSDSEPS
jgi:hypothetical protein